MKNAKLLIIAVISLSFGFMISSLVFESKPLKLEAGQWFGDQARALPDFELIDHDKQVFGLAQLRGKWSLIFFGYTQCPDICPTTLQTLSEMMDSIEDDDVRRVLQVLFVSVDPDRDSDTIIKSYLEYFHPDFIGATAVLPDLNRLTGALGIMHSRDKTSENQIEYGVSHSGSVLLINPEAEFAGLFGAPLNGLAMARDLGKIIQHY